MKKESVIEATSHWVTSVVVGLNLCPFAKREVVKDRVRYQVTDTSSEQTLLALLQGELQRLSSDPAIETTLLIHPNALTDFLDYVHFLEQADQLLVALDLEGVYQIASFHPHYQFANTEPGDVENYTNRSPYPMLHLLREASLTQAIERYPDPDAIPENNIEMMKQKGEQVMQQMLQRCYGSAD